MSEQLDYDTLLSLMKEKTKEVNSLQRKLSKLEERYVSKHREYIETHSERELLFSFIQSILEKKIEGKLVYEDLESAWASKEEDSRRVLKSLNENLEKTLAETESLKEKLAMQDAQISEISELRYKLLTLNKENEEKTAEKEFLEKEMTKLRSENSNLKAEYSQLSEIKSSNLIAKMDQSPVNSDFEKVQKQLAEANTRIAMLETDIEARMQYSERHDDNQELLIAKHKLENHVLELEKNLTEVKDEFKEHRQKAQKIVLEKEQMIERMRRKDQSEEISELSARIRYLENSHSSESVNMEYVKNIVMKFMEYMYTGNAKEAATVAAAIFTVLNFSEEETQLVSDARNASKIYNTVSSFFVTKSPGVGVSHNTLRINESRRRSTLENSHIP